MAETEYCDVVASISADLTRKLDGHADAAETFHRIADTYDAAAALAPPDVAAAWTTLGRSLRRFVTIIDADVLSDSVTPEDAASERAAASVVTSHVQQTCGLELTLPVFSFTPEPRPEGPPPPIPDEPAYDVPDGPADEAEFQRLLAAFTMTDTSESAEPAVRWAAAQYERITEVAPPDLRPAFAVLTAMMQDTADRERDPEARRRPGRVSQEQINAALRTVEAAELD